jgi:hypothetical protein
MSTPLTLWGITLDSGLLAALLAFCAVTATIMLLRARQFRQVTGRELAREQIARLREQREIRLAMDELLGRLEAFNRQVNEQLDAKLRAVEAALAMADERIGRLGAQPTPVMRNAAEPEREPAGPAIPDATTSTEARDETVASNAVQSAIPDRVQRRARRLAALRQPVETAARADRAAAGPAPAPERGPVETEAAASAAPPASPVAIAATASPASRCAAPRAAISPHHQRVHDLFDEGHSPIGIAEELGVSLGEVELILNLRNYG